MNRRSLLAAAPAILAAGVGVTGIAAAPPSRDAELIATCAEHIVNLKTYNRDGGYLECADDPLWQAYERTLDAIDCAETHTVEGMLAKARAAKAEALQLDGSDNWQNGTAARWAGDLLCALLAGDVDLAGRA